MAPAPKRIGTTLTAESRGSGVGPIDSPDNIYYVYIMATKKHIGDFEFMVLAAVLQVEAEAYGVSIRQEIESRTGRSVSMGAVHATLTRLEKKGYLSSAFSAPTPHRGGKARRLFRVEPAGREAFIEAASAVQAMLAGLGGIAVNP